MKKFQNLGRVLSKNEQKKVNGGDPGCPSCVHCHGTGGSCGSYLHECYCRTDQDPNACYTIFSGCTSVYGELGACAGCIMN